MKIAPLHQAWRPHTPHRLPCHWGNATSEQGGFRDRQTVNYWTSRRTNIVTQTNNHWAVMKIAPLHQAWRTNNATPVTLPLRQRHKRTRRVPRSADSPATNESITSGEADAVNIAAQNAVKCSGICETESETNKLQVRYGSTNRVKRAKILDSGHRHAIQAMDTHELRTSPFWRSGCPIENEETLIWNSVWTASNHWMTPGIWVSSNPT